jgi:protein ImuB
MAEVPDGPPLNFRWRRARYRIVNAEGPERIEPEWWRESLPVVAREENEKERTYEDRRKAAAAGRLARRSRDYFTVEDAEGRRYWLYRQGLYGLSGETPRWFLHGLFA